MASGRIQDLAVDPFNSNHILALADSALWQSANGGRNWSALTGLERFGQWNFEHGSLVFDPLVRGVVLIASPSDRRTHTEVGIYRSTDGGQNWQPALNFQAQCPDGTTIGSPSVVMFSHHTAYAAARCKVGTSTDDGLTWTWSAPDSGGDFSGVTVDAAGNLFACGRDGVFMQFKGAWKQVVDFSRAGWRVGAPVDFTTTGTCRLGAAPKQPMHVFFAGVWSGLLLNCPPYCDSASAIFEVYFDQGSWHWQDLRGSRFANGRDVFIQTRPDTAGGYDLFWHNTDLVEYQRCSGGAGFECTPGSSATQLPTPNPPWIPLGYDPPPGLHADATRIIFEPGSPFCIRFIADDSGIEKPDSGNCNGTAKAWSYSDVGIDAAEFYELATTSITGLRDPGTDLYAAAQDNGAFWRPSNGRWEQVDLGHDGLAIDATIRAHVSSARGLQTIRTFYNANDSQILGNRGLAKQVGPPASKSPFTAPCIGLQPFNQHQLDQIGNTALVALCVRSDGSSSIYSSPLAGFTWAQLTGTLVTGQPNGLYGESLFVTAPTAATTGYVIQDTGNLWTIHPPQAPRQRLTGWNVGPVAVSHDGSKLLTFACPRSPATCADGEVLTSSDGGRDWRSLRAALDLGSRDRWGHGYRLDVDGVAKQIAAVAIDPYNSRLWAIGTLDLGLLASGDSGRSWQRQPTILPNINSLRFDVFDRLYVGTYGRGVFGGIEPEPDRLDLVADAGKIASGKGQYFQWIATARTFPGAAISGRIIRFILINLTHGTRTEVGLAATNAQGLASRRAFVRAGNYAVEAIWQPRNGADLETQTTFTARS